MRRFPGGTPYGVLPPGVPFAAFDSVAREGSLMETNRELLEKHEPELSQLCTRLADILEQIHGNQPINKLDIRIDGMHLYHFTWTRE